MKTEDKSTLLNEDGKIPTHAIVNVVSMVILLPPVFALYRSTGMSDMWKRNFAIIA